MIRRRMSALTALRHAARACAAVLLLLVSASCSPQPASLSGDAFIWAFAISAYETRVVMSACQSYYASHGHWPATGADLAGTATSIDGVRFDPADFHDLDLRPLNDGALGVRYRIADCGNLHNTARVDRPGPGKPGATTAPHSPHRDSPRVAAMPSG